MAIFYQENFPEYKDSLEGDSLPDPHGPEEPMKLDKDIIDQEGSADLVEEEPNCLGWGPNNIFEQDVSATSPQPSVYRMSQLLADVNTPTPEDHSEKYPPSSPTTEAALQTSDLDWADEVEQAAPSQPELEE